MWDPPRSGMEPVSPALQADSLPLSPQGIPAILNFVSYFYFAASYCIDGWEFNPPSIHPSTDKQEVVIECLLSTKVCLLVPQYYVMLNTYSALQAVLLCWSQRPESSYLKENGRTSLVIQWIKIHLPMQGTCVQSLVWEGGCHRGIKTASHNCWSLCSETREAATRRSPCTTTRVAPVGRN